jgi:radical SAM/Cys-rich protein
MLTLKRQGSPLASAAVQLDILGQGVATALPQFHEVVARFESAPLQASDVSVLQINLGKICNQTCAHCHVDAGPERREIMTRETLEACLAVVARTQITTVDLTGGAPEMNPNFKWFVAEVRSLGRRVIDRCNLTILKAPGFDSLPEFLADHEVEIVASLPCYLEENCDRQRGDGVFAISIEMLQRLNRLGYGQPDGRLPLNLVYNPVGTSLPPAQDRLEADYRVQLRSRFQIEFTKLFTITNMPISRYLDSLLQSGKYDAYMQRLIDAFNPATLETLMCRSTLSVDWQGRLFDCDFNQMLDLPVAAGFPNNIRDLPVKDLADRPIVTRRHCFGCTAGRGSSCGGTLV